MSESTTITRDAFGKAYGKYFATTVRVLTARKIPYDVAEEVAQEAWFLAWERLHQLRNPEMLLAWVKAIVKTSYGTYRRRERFIIRDEMPMHIEAPSHDRDARRLVEEILRWTEPGDRNLISLRFLRGMTTREIADDVGVTEAAAKARLYRAIHVLEIIHSKHRPVVRICPQSQ